MMYLINFIYDLANSDGLYYVLIVLLIIISVVMLYLMYSQNKEIAKQLSEKNNPKKNIVEEKNESTIKEVESLDGREELLEISKMTIPKHLEYTQTLFSNTELQELRDITKELESSYKDRQNDIDDYEEAQEESAIISYDELLNKTQAIPKVVVEDTKAVNDTHSHEEAFLNKLKDLNSKLK